MLTGRDGAARFDVELVDSNAHEPARMPGCIGEYGRSQVANPLS
jgi:hypothetical protein